MKKKEISTLAQLGNYASVDFLGDTESGIVNINFMNASMRMCRHQFKLFTIMLNQAHATLDADEQCHSDVIDVFNISKNVTDKSVN